MVLLCGEAGVGKSYIVFVVKELATLTIPERCYDQYSAAMASTPGTFDHSSEYIVPTGVSMVHGVQIIL